MKAAKIGDEEEVQYLLNEGVDADYKNEVQYTLPCVDHLQQICRVNCYIASFLIIFFVGFFDVL